MAINLVPFGTAGAPITSGDYDAQNNNIAANAVPMLSVLSGWATTGAAPAIKQGAFIRHAGNNYKVESGDESISGAPASGINYIELTLAGTVITAEWVTSLSGYSYNPAYGGIYNGAGQQIIRDICLLDGTDYIRGLSNGMDFKEILYSSMSNTPIGYVYIQFPGKDDPATLGLPGVWTNISSDFPGDFFRAEGGDASAFESGQQSDENKPHTHPNDTRVTGTAGTFIKGGGVSGAIPTPTGSSGTTESRPKNRSIRLWERTA